MASHQTKIYHVFMLLPFFLSVTAYFSWLVPHGEPSLYVATIKCLPILCLVLYVLVAQKLLGGAKHKTQHEKQIILGLIFSAIGDVCLVWNNLFIIGMLAFGIGHVYYTLALGFRPLKLHFGLIMSLFGVGMLLALHEGLSGIFLYAVPVYSVLLATMSWRALSFEAADSVMKFIISLGGLSWAASDSILAYDKFVTPVPYAQILIMSTYYFGQFGITMTVLEGKKQKKY